MRRDRWWHLLFGLTMAVLAGVFVLNLDGGTDERVPLVSVGVMSVSYVVFGRRGYDSGSSAVVLFAVMAVCSGLGTAFDPNMAIVQCIAMPIIWVQLDRTRDAIIGNVLFVAVISAGMLTFFGFTAHGWIQVSLVEGISLVGSLSLGLWISRVFELSDERRRLLDDLRAAQSQVAALSHEAGATSERERLARDLHDTIAQSLTGLVLLGQRASRELDVGDTTAAADSIAHIEETARDALLETRTLVASTAPVGLDGGLPAALERLGQRFARETRISVDVSVDLGGVSLGRDVEVVLLRTAQEALANVRKHSGAGAASIELRRDGSEARLTVADDGCGFSPAAVAEGFGLAGVRARIELVGGTVSVDSGEGRGARLGVSVPVSGADPAPVTPPPHMSAVASTASSTPVSPHRTTS